MTTLTTTAFPALFAFMHTPWMTGKMNAGLIERRFPLFQMCLFLNVLKRLLQVGFYLDIFGDAL